MGMEALPWGCGNRGAQYPVQPTAARHHREPRLQSPPENASGRVFPARKKVVGQAFLPAQALKADEAGFEPKAGSFPIGDQGGRPGSLSLQDLLPGWAELERTGSWSETRAQRPRARAELPHFSVGSPGTPFPCPLCLRTTQACLGTVRARTRSRSRGTARSFWPWWPLHSTLHPRLHTGASN